MFPSDAKALTALHLLSAGAAANTAAATSAVVDVSDYEGSLCVVQNVGVVTAGTIVGKIQTGAESNGSDMADITGAAFASVGTSTDNASQVLVIEANACKQYIRYVGTIATGPADVGVVALGAKKYV